MFQFVQVERYFLMRDALVAEGVVQEVERHPQDAPAILRDFEEIIESVPVRIAYARRDRDEPEPDPVIV